MSERSVPAMAAPAPSRDNPLTRSVAGVVGLVTLGVLVLACVGTLPWTLGMVGAEPGELPPFAQGDLDAALLPPFWAPHTDEDRARLDALSPPGEEPPAFWMGTDKLGRSVLVRSLTGGGISIGVGIAAAAIAVTIGTLYGAIAGYLGGRLDSVMMRVVDVLYGLPYILLVVLLAVAGETLVDEWAFKKLARQSWVSAEAAAELERRGETDAEKERIREFLDEDQDFRASIEAQLDMGPYKRIERADGTGRDDAFDAWLDERAPALLVTRDRAPDIDAAAALLEADPDARREARRAFNRLMGLHPRPLSGWQLQALDVLILLLAIGGVSWLTMARVIRGQVLSLRNQPFMEAARAMGVGVPTQFRRHLLPNLLGPIIVYATLTVPQAILQESFLSFLGIGVQPPLPSWGNLAAEGLVELNTVRVRWWLIVFPCLLLGITLLALNFVGEGLREAFDPKRARQ